MSNTERGERGAEKGSADYMHSEGCSCYQDIDGHNKHKEALAKLLHVKKYSDGSGYDFRRYRTKEQPNDR
jgi:hypothetical protein